MKWLLIGGGISVGITVLKMLAAPSNTLGILQNGYPVQGLGVSFVFGSLIYGGVLWLAFG